MVSTMWIAIYVYMYSPFGLLPLFFRGGGGLLSFPFLSLSPGRAAFASSTPPTERRRQFSSWEARRRWEGQTS